MLSIIIIVDLPVTVHVRNIQVFWGRQLIQMKILQQWKENWGNFTPWVSRTKNDDVFFIKKRDFN